MSIGSDLLRYKKDQKFLIADYETEGLNKAYSRPWQLSFATFTLEKIIKEYDFYIYWEDLNISEGAKKVTGFNEQFYLERAQEPELVCNTFEEYLYNPEYIVLYHNGLAFDTMIHQVLRRSLGKKPDYSFMPRSYDTNCLLKMYKLGIKPDRNDIYRQQVKMISYIQKGLKTNLAQVAGEFGIEFDKTKLHNSLYDIRLNIEVFKSVVWKMEI